jgi:hypothetical protein
MDSLASSTVAAASAASQGSVQGSAAISVMKKALNLQANSAAQLIQALPQPGLATSGSVGTKVNTFA